jgi:hypothetical protein
MLKAIPATLAKQLTIKHPIKYGFHASLNPKPGFRNIAIQQAIIASMGMLNKQLITNPSFFGSCMTRCRLSGTEDAIPRCLLVN